MTDPRDAVSEADLDAYLDDQLEPLRRIEVEAWLAARPGLAARAMADLRVRDELRLALAGWRPAGRPETVDLARRLNRALSRDRRLLRLRRLAAAVTLVGAGWLGHAALAPTVVTASPPHPAFVADALRAHGAAALRAGMESQPKASRLDAAEIRSATGIALPALPEGWAVRDAQVFPSPNGPSVELALAVEELGGVSLFAVRPGGFDVIAPRRGPEGEAASAYFQIGDAAYVLVAPADTGEALERAAAGLARSLY